MVAVKGKSSVALNVQSDRKFWMPWHPAGGQIGWMKNCDSIRLSSAAFVPELAMVSAMYRDEYASVMDRIRVHPRGWCGGSRELRARREAVRVASGQSRWWLVLPAHVQSRCWRW